MPVYSALWTLPVGCLFGIAVWPPVARWLALCRRLVLTRAGRREMLASRQKFTLSLIALLLHPAPWLLAIGVPWAVQRLRGAPTGPLWLWFGAGALLGSLAAYAWERWRAAAHAVTQARSGPA